MAIAIRGAGCTIARSLARLKAVDAHGGAGYDPVIAVARGEPMPLDATRYLFCQGLLLPKPTDDLTDDERRETHEANAGQIVRDCDRLIAANDAARICVIGSESGYAGSYNLAYAAAKAGLHRYVESKELRTPRQQLVAVAPTIIADAGMTLRRTDHAQLAERAALHPKRRWLSSDEVARLVFFLLYVDQGYISGVVIRMNGGPHAADATHG